MGKIRIPENVLLICAVCYSPTAPVQEAMEKLTAEWGPIAAQTPAKEFRHTQYYQHEMGSRLKKFYCTFQATIPPQTIVEAKLFTNTLEEKYSRGENRSINLDPGYIEVPKLVLATTKNYSHRIYLNTGIYGDVQLFWQNGAFHANPWTYPDYQETDVVEFFTKSRNEYFNTLKRGKTT